ncbi:MAG TPA: alanine dehydrogenase [Casimicrobiaceae bacterium]|nr:alanine dehydrogenase [Casimicrobiaceae bacterium]
MRIGVPTEIKAGEYRVGLTPASAHEYVRAGHDVLIQRGAGAGMGAEDATYISAGARIVETAEEVFSGSDMIVKVKEPQPAEWGRLREDQILFAYLHLAPDRAQACGLVESRCTAIAYETVTDERGRLPLLAPMSEVAGRLAVEAAGFALRRQCGGRGLLLGGVPGVAPARVLVLGGGVVGGNAARMAVGLGADVTVIDASIDRLRELDANFKGRIRTRYADHTSIEEEVLAADAVIGAVLVAGASAPKLVSRTLLARMKKGSVLVDVSIDQGGCFETSRPTTYDKPTYVVDGVVHYCVANMPAAVPGTSTIALNNATLKHGLALASGGLDALRKDRYLRAGLNVHRGEITNRAVAEALDLPYRTIESALGIAA